MKQEAMEDILSLINIKLNKGNLTEIKVRSLNYENDNT